MIPLPVVWSFGFCISAGMIFSNPHLARLPHAIRAPHYHTVCITICHVSGSCRVFCECSVCSKVTYISVIMHITMVAKSRTQMERRLILERTRGTNNCVIPSVIMSSLDTYASITIIRCDELSCEMIPYLRFLTSLHMQINSMRVCGRG